jgi:bla regulator protein BlaR1
MIMSINVFDKLFNLRGMHTVFVMLADSLWIGALMALVAGIIITLTKKHGPQLRYQLLTGLLALFVLSMAFVFYTAFVSDTHATADSNKTMIVAITSTSMQANSVQPEQKNVFDSLISFIQANADVIVSIWFMVIIFRCLQLISGLNSLQRMKRRWIMEAGDQWNQKLHELATKLGIRRHVIFLQSSLAKVPMVIGHLKPVLLFPMGLLNNLPQDQVEAILLHELAHIKRNDFLVNLLQQFAEIFFFFNPAVLWISSLIKNERENCCDDIALSITRNKKIFIHALVAFQEYNAGVKYAATFSGSKNHLLNRVKRIITNNNKTLNTMEKLVLASCIVLTCLATAAFNPGKEKNKIDTVKRNEVTGQAIAQNIMNTEAKSTSSKLAERYSDSIPGKQTGVDNYNTNFKGDIDGKRVELKEENSKIKELYIDGKKIPEDEYAQYQPMIEKIHTQMKEQTAKLKIQSEKLALQKEQLQKQAEEMKIDSKKMKEQNEIAEADLVRKKEFIKQKQREIKMQEQAERMQKKDESMKIQSQKMQKDLIQKEEFLKEKQMELQQKMEELKLRQKKLELMRKDSVKVTTSIYTKPVISVRPTITVKPSVSATSTVNLKPVAIAATTATVNSKLSVMSAISADSRVDVKPVVYAVTSTLPKEGIISITRNSTAEDIVSDLEKANVITSRDNLSIQLSNESLIVNGVKQPEEIHQEILKKHMKTPGDKITLLYNNRE